MPYNYRVRVVRGPRENVLELEVESSSKDWVEKTTKKYLGK